jgi:intracellular septation protein A
MAATPDASPDSTSISAPSHRPHLRDVLARVAVSLTTAVFAPAALLWAMLVLFNVAIAVSVALAWMVGAMCWRWATKRPVSGLLLMTLGIMTVRTAFTLVTGNTFIYFLQPVFADFAVAAIFLGSLWSARPVIARLAPDFYPMSAAVAARPEMRALFRRLTLMWGLVILVKGCVTLWLLETLSTVNFVLIKGGAIITLTLTAAVVTVVWSVIVGRQEGLVRPARRRV